MSLDFPQAPTLGQTFPAPAIVGHPLYTWDGEKWTSDLLAVANAPTGNFVSKTGDTMTGSLTISVAGASLVLNKPDDSYLTIYGMKHNFPRWRMDLGDGAAESGGNVGDNFNIHRFDDSGGYLGTPLNFSRATGNATFGAGIWATSGNFSGPVNGTTANFSGGVWTTTGTFSGAISAASATISGALNTGSTTVNGNIYVTNQADIIGPLNVHGVHTDYSNLQVNGTATVNSTLSVGGTGWFGQTLTANSNFVAGGSILTYSTLEAYGRTVVHQGIQYAGPGPAALEYSSDGYHRWWVAQATCIQYNPNTQWEITAPSGPISYFRGADYVFCHNGSAYKPGGGSWLDFSDARIKDVKGDYTHGLAELLQLRPIRYQFKGNITMSLDPNADPAHKNVLDTEFIGLVAQEAEQPMPELVTNQTGFIDGVQVDDLRILDPNALTYALINAVKELSAEVEALKTQIGALRT